MLKFAIILVAADSTLDVELSMGYCSDTSENLRLDLLSSGVYLGFNREQVEEDERLGPRRHSQLEFRNQFFGGQLGRP